MFRREWFAKPLNASLSGAVAIKNNGCVVGSSDDGNATDGFLWTGSGTIQNIGTLGGDTTYAFGINDAGTVIGASQVASGTYHGFKYSNDVMTDTGTLANKAINNSAQRAESYSSGIGFEPAYLVNASGQAENIGQIEGIEISANGAEHAFLLTPIREPSALALLLAAAAGWVAIKPGRFSWRETAFRVIIEATVAIAVFLVCADTRASAQTVQYSITDLGTLRGPAGSLPTAMNSLGQVVGDSDIYTQYAHSFLYAGGSMMRSAPARNALQNGPSGMQVQAALKSVRQSPESRFRPPPPVDPGRVCRGDCLSTWDAAAGIRRNWGTWRANSPRRR